MFGRSAICLLFIAFTACADDPKPPILTESEQTLLAQTKKMDAEAAQLYQQGKTADAIDAFRRCLDSYQKIYREKDYPAGHPDLTGGLNNLGMVLHAAGHSEESRIYLEQALKMARRVYLADKPDGAHPHVATSLSNLASVMLASGNFEEAWELFDQAVTMFRKLYPVKDYPDGHAGLATALNNQGEALREAGRYDEARTCHEQALAMRRRLVAKHKQPVAYAELAFSLNNVGMLLRAMGNFQQARGHFDEALALRRELYPVEKFPVGHPQLATSLNNLAFAYFSEGNLAAAGPPFEEALAMRRRLFPKDRFPAGHPDLAQSVNNLASWYRLSGDFVNARPLYDESLQMRRRLYPADKFPSGHPAVAESLVNLGYLLSATGEDEKARVQLEEALAMRQALTDRYIAAASEADALSFVEAQPLTRDWYLSVTSRLPEGVAETYRAIWPSRAAVTRLLEQRHAAARAAGTEQAGALERLKSLRRRAEQILQDRRMTVARRDAMLAEVVAQRDALERSLAVALPVLPRWKERDALGPDALRDLLPAGTAFIDLIAYTQLTFHRTATGQASGNMVRCYVAFVVTPGKPCRRVELGEAKPIDDALDTWRNQIENRQAQTAAKTMRKLVWEPLARQLPQETKTVYLAPDGDLARTPWSALPGAQPDTVLLEEYSLAVVPHGPFLSEQLRFPQKTTGPDSALAIGGLDYGSSAWPALDGTAREVQTLGLLASNRYAVLNKNDATAKRLTSELSQVRYAHLATHGYFDAQRLKAEKKRTRDAARDWAIAAAGNERRVAASNPLGFVGLVLSGGEVLTGLSLVDLPLENVKLVTLSACETGLGELTGGEGVQGLQRAFHLAGCPNVIASLWKVNDAATAALMAKFYHEMWVNKQKPLAALRSAQLFIYYNPDKIPDVLGERGAPNAKEALSVKPVAASQTKRADTKLWAAFVLSGLGR